MRVTAIKGSIHNTTTELAIVNLFEGAESLGGATAVVDTALGGAIQEMVDTGDLKGKLGETRVLYTRGAIAPRRILVVGLGATDDLTLDSVRLASAAAVKAAQSLGATEVASIVHGAGAGGLDVAEAAQATVEGAILGAYTYAGLKTDTQSIPPAIESLQLVQFGADLLTATEQGVKWGDITGRAVCLARDLANSPANYMTPMLLAEQAQVVAAEVGLDCKVMGEREMAELGMGALLGVAQGSQEEAQFIILEHNAGQPDLETRVIVGKGITFDSGGISLKAVQGMEDMKFDMSGAAVTLAVMQAVAEMDLPMHVVGLMPATENLPGGRAYKPGDVLESMSGQTIEVISTDAEGRLILADALHYAKRYQPEAVVDLATLTGGCVVALGQVATGLMGSDEMLIDQIKAAAVPTGDKVWQLPLYEEYNEQIKSDVADVKNSGGRAASTITAGQFLRRFTGDYAWAHLDVAGTAWSKVAAGYKPKGSTGSCVRLLIQWLRDCC